MKNVDIIAQNIVWNILEIIIEDQIIMEIPVK